MWHPADPVEDTLRRIVRHELACYLHPRNHRRPLSLHRALKQEPLLMAFARELLMTFKKPPVPGFSQRTQAVVMKWFRRGISGRLLWRIGDDILCWRFPKEWSHEG